MMADPENKDSPYLIAVCVLTPVAAVSLVLFFVYALCLPKRRSNWYENTLLEEKQRQTTIRFTVTQADDSETESVHGGRDKIGEFAYCGERSDLSEKKVKWQPTTSIVEVLRGLRKLTTRFKSLGERDTALQNGNTTDWIVCTRKRMGSSPSSPVHESVEEKFWVPPAVVDRKRAQSLVPTICHDSEDGMLT